MAQATAQAQNTKDDKTVFTPVPPTVPAKGKELEPSGNEEKILKEIVEVSTEADREAEGKIRREIGDIKAGEPKPQIPKDVQKSGVSSPEDDASDVLKKGNTINLGVTEDEYRRGLREKIKAKVIDKNVIGISSLVGVVIRVGRLIKEGHKRALKMVFKKGKGGESAG